MAVEASARDPRGCSDCCNYCSYDICCSCCGHHTGSLQPLHIAIAAVGSASAVVAVVVVRPP